MRFLHQNKYLVLLLTIVALVSFQPHAQRPAGIGSLLFDFVLLLPLAVVAYAVFRRRWERIVAACAAAAGIAAVLLQFWGRPEDRLLFKMTYEAMIVAFLAFAVWTILRNIFLQKSVSMDDVIGSVCGYLMAGIAWGNAYVMIAAIQPDAFSMGAEAKAQMGDWGGSLALFRYFSFIVLTTVGFGDITPLRPPVTTLVWLEALFGQFYVAIVVAQLVAVRLTQAMGSGKRGG